MKILFVHEVNWKKKPIFEIHDYPELLSLRGHEVSFIDFPEHEKLIFKRKFGTLATTESANQSRAHSGSSVKLITPGRICGAPFDRLLHSLTFVPLLAKTLWGKKYEVIVLYGVPTNGWQTVLIAKLFRVPVLYRAIDISHELRKTKFKTLIKLAERIVYRLSNQISTNNATLADYCASFGAKREQISVDYPGLDLVRFSPTAKDRNIQATLEIDDNDKTILFMGTLFRFSGLIRFLDLSNEILQLRPDIKVLIVGDGEARTDIENSISSYGLSGQVKLTGFVSYDDLPKFLNLADVAINTFEVGLVTNGAMPWKVVQYLACGLPTVSTPLSGLVSYTNLKVESGVIYRNLDSSFPQAVVELLDDQTLRKKLSRHARELVVARNSWSECLPRFEQLLNGLTTKQ